MADPMSYYQDPNLTQAREQALTSADTASGYQTAASSLPQKLEQAIQEKLDYNKDLISEKNKAQADYIAAPAVAREKYQDIFNPFTRESLVAQEKAGAYVPYANLVDILGQRQNSVKDTIQTALSAYQSAVTAAENAATLNRQKYQDLFNYAKELSGTEISKQQLAKTSQGSESKQEKTQAETQMTNDVASYKTLEEIVRKYSPVLDLYKIVNTYNAFHTGQGGEPWGPAKEPISNIQQWTKILPGPTSSDQKSQAIRDLTTDIGSAAKDSKYKNNANQLFLDLKNVYPELSDSQIKSLMRANGLNIY